MNKRGFVLLEMLVALTLFAIAGSMLAISFAQGIKVNQKVHRADKQYDPLRLAFMQLERDLRNTVILKDYPFMGKKDEIQFPGLLTESVEGGGKIKSLYLLHYYLKDKNLIRSAEKLGTQLVREKPKVKILVKDLSDFVFQFPYLDAESQEVFESFWLEEPYFGIPRSMKIKIVHADLELEKIVSIPQGEMGHLLYEA